MKLFGLPSHDNSLPWKWANDQLTSAGTYWVVARHHGRPHPRPVWGIWYRRRLHLSIGSPAILTALHTDPAVAVHLDSGTDVVIVEGRYGGGSINQAVIKAYNAKYRWDYKAAEYGELVVIQPTAVLAWRAAGRAGRDGFEKTGRWTFDRTDPGTDRTDPGTDRTDPGTDPAS